MPIPVPHAVTSAHLRERAYEARCRGDWNLGERLEAQAVRMDAKRASKRAEKVHGVYSKESVAAFREYRLATAKVLELDLKS